jgi:hypothetical protein
MAKKSESFNVTAAVREYRESHPGGSAKEAFEAIKKAHPKERLNENSLKTTFYKLARSGKRKVVRRRKPGRVVAAGGGNHAESIMRAGLTFIRLAGGVENARERLAGLKDLIETAKEVG